MENYTLVPKREERKVDHGVPSFTIKCVQVEVAVILVILNSITQYLMIRDLWNIFSIFFSFINIKLPETNITK